MVYKIPFEADFECPDGHKFVAPVSPVASTTAAPICPECHAIWIRNNVHAGVQTSVARRADLDKYKGYPL